jgi:hypothetical protein
MKSRSDLKNAEVGLELRIPIDSILVDVTGVTSADWRSNDGTGDRKVVPQPANSLLGTPGGRRPRLQQMLNPKIVAVIGATETPGSVGRALMENLLSFARIFTQSTQSDPVYSA